MRLIKFTIIFFLFFYSCKKNNKIEIYLLNNRKLNQEGLSINKFIQLKKYKYNDLKEFPKYTTFDTIKGEIIDASDFYFDKDDLRKYPFIKDNEIISVDFENAEIILKREASLRIIKLKPGRNGIQFVITVNGKPNLGGYFWNPYSSLMCNSNYIQYKLSDFKLDSTKNEFAFNFYRGLGTKSGNKGEKINIKKYKELEIALKNSNRLNNSSR